MFFNASRVAAVLAAGGYLLIAILSGTMVTALNLLFYLILPLVCMMIPKTVAVESSTTEDQDSEDRTVIV